MMHTTSLLSLPKPAVLLGLLVVATMAGCIDQAAQECERGVCTQTAQPGDAFLTNATRPTASLNRCAGVGLGANVPPDWLDDELPDAFYPEGLVPNTAQLQIFGVECSDVVVNGTIADHVRFAYSSVDAAPQEREWQGMAPSSYIFQYYVDNDDVAAELAKLGVPAQVAKIEVERTTAVAGTVEAWTINAASHSFSYSLGYAKGDGGGRSSEFHLWAGEDEFQRFDLNLTYQFEAGGGLTPSTVTMFGDSAPRRILGVDHYVFYGQVWAARTEEWTPYPLTFTR